MKSSYIIIATFAATLLSSCSTPEPKPAYPRYRAKVVTSDTIFGAARDFYRSNDRWPASTAELREFIFEGNYNISSADLAYVDITTTPSGTGILTVGHKNPSTGMTVKESYDLPRMTITKAEPEESPADGQ